MSSNCHRQIVVKFLDIYCHHPSKIIMKNYDKAKEIKLIFVYESNEKLIYSVLKFLI